MSVYWLLSAILEAIVAEVDRLCLTPADRKEKASDARLFEELVAKVMDAVKLRVADLLDALNDATDGHVSVNHTPIELDEFYRTAIGLRLLQPLTARTLTVRLVFRVLYDLIRFVPDAKLRELRLTDLLLAYACGWGGCTLPWKRKSHHHGRWTNPWFEEWPRASEVLFDWIVKDINYVNRWLKWRLRCPGDLELPNVLEVTPAYAALWLLPRFIHGRDPIPLGPERVMTIEYVRAPSDPVEDGYTVVRVGTVEWKIPYGARLDFTVTGMVELIIPGPDSTPVHHRIASNSRLIITTSFTQAAIRCWVIPVKKKKGGAGSMTPVKKNISLSAGQIGRLIGLQVLTRWVCGCGGLHCHTRHNLEAWRPCLEFDLHSYLASALNGPLADKSGGLRMRTRTLVEGMYLAWLALGAKDEPPDDEPPDDEPPGIGPTGVEPTDDGPTDDVSFPRLVMVPVEFSVCTRQDMRHRNAMSRRTVYEGDVCRCRRRFNRVTDRRFWKRVLILVHTSPAVYESVKRCTCPRPQCKNLFEITPADVRRHYTCQACGEMLWEKKMLWDEDAQCGILKPTTSLLVQARAVEKARRELGQCPHCHTALAVLPWCPLCAAEEPPVTAWRLPERELTVWRRIFFAAPGPLPPVLPAGPTPPAPDTEPTGDEDDREDTDTDNTGDDNEN